MTAEIYEPHIPVTSFRENLKKSTDSTLRKNDSVNISKFNGTRRNEASLWSWLRNEVKWKNTIVLVVIHVLGFYTLADVILNLKWKTYLITMSIGFLSGIGTTAGVHRLWTHRSYKANTPLRIILIFLYLNCGQYKVSQWVRDHRAHHKYSETDADPHNSKRGFFFSHAGWLMVERRPEVIEKVRAIDISDIYADPVVAFADKYFWYFTALLIYILPPLAYIYFGNESVYWAVMYSFMRHMIQLNHVWTVNSIAHLYGNKPYNKNIAPVESTLVSYFANGEGWHNYHHTFPTDYRAAEIGGGRWNLTSHFIDFFAKIGWATDLNVPSESLVRMTIANKGDGSHENYNKIRQMTKLS